MQRDKSAFVAIVSFRGRERDGVTPPVGALRPGRGSSSGLLLRLPTPPGGVAPPLSKPWCHPTPAKKRLSPHSFKNGMGSGKRGPKGFETGEKEWSLSFSDFRSVGR